MKDFCCCDTVFICQDLEKYTKHLEWQNNLVLIFKQDNRRDFNNLRLPLYFGFFQICLSFTSFVELIQDISVAPQQQ